MPLYPYGKRKTPQQIAVGVSVSWSFVSGGAPVTSFRDALNQESSSASGAWLPACLWGFALAGDRENLGSQSTPLFPLEPDCPVSLLTGGRTFSLVIT